MGIRVSGTIDMRGNYTVELDMTEAEFDSLSERKINDVIGDAIDWREWMNLAEVNDVDVDDLDEIE